MALSSATQHAILPKFTTQNNMVASQMLIISFSSLTKIVTYKSRIQISKHEVNSGGFTQSFLNWRPFCAKYDFLDHLYPRPVSEWNSVDPFSSILLNSYSWSSLNLLTGSTRQLENFTNLIKKNVVFGFYSTMSNVYYKYYNYSLKKSVKCKSDSSQYLSMKNSD